MATVSGFQAPCHALPQPDRGYGASAYDELAWPRNQCDDQIAHVLFGPTREPAHKLATSAGNPGPRSSRRDGLLPEVEELLIDVVADGFTLYCCGPKAAPNALVASYEWDRSYVDLLTIQDFARVITARVPTSGLPVDIFDPEVVVWAYEGPPEYAVRALQDLVHPDHPDAPTTAYPAPSSLRVLRARQRPMSIQLPLPSPAGVRGERLATAMRTPGVPAGTDQDRRLVAG